MQFYHRYSRDALWRLLEGIAADGGISHHTQKSVRMPDKGSKAPHIADYYLSDKALFDFFNDMDHEPVKRKKNSKRDVNASIEFWNSEHALGARIMIRSGKIGLILDPCDCATPQFCATVGFCIIRAISPQSIILCPADERYTTMIAVNKLNKRYQDKIRIFGRPVQNKTLLLESIAKQYAREYPP